MDAANPHYNLRMAQSTTSAATSDGSTSSAVPLSHALALWLLLRDKHFAKRQFFCMIEAGQDFQVNFTKTG